MKRLQSLLILSLLFLLLIGCQDESINWPHPNDLCDSVGKQEVTVSKEYCDKYFEQKEGLWIGL